MCNDAKMVLEKLDRNVESINDAIRSLILATGDLRRDIERLSECNAHASSTDDVIGSTIPSRPCSKSSNTSAEVTPPSAFFTTGDMCRWE